jgi:RecA/RadA recombinase
MADNSDEKTPAKRRGRPPRSQLIATGKDTKPASKRGRKKSSESVDVFTATPAALVLDKAMGNLMQTLKNDKGASNLIDNQKQAELVGLPIPSLMLQHVLGTTVLPLSRIFQIVGEEGSCKSSFLYEIMRWFCVYNGLCVISENENKDAKDLREAILEHKQEYLQRVATFPTHCVEDWQTLITRTVQSNKEVMIGTKSKPGVGKTYPVLIGVDSIKGTGLRNAIDKIMDEGFASPEFPKFAAVITQYMQTIPKLIGGFPFLIIGTNHLKPGVHQTNPNIPVENVPGGKSIKFMETYEIKMEKMGEIKKKDLSGVKLRFRSRKSATGPTKLFGDASFVWTYDKKQVPAVDDDGNLIFDAHGENVLLEVSQQRAWWDWTGADIEFLLSWLTEYRKDITRGKKLARIVDLQEHTSNLGKTVSSKALGIPEDKPVSYSEAGKLLHARPDLLRKLRNELGILDRAVFKPGLDYAKQVEAAVAAEQARAAARGEILQDASDVFEDDEE